MKNMFTLRKRSSLLSLVVITLSSFILSACGIGIAESDITVYKDKYELDTVISVSAESMQMIGGPEVFEEALNEEINEIEGEGVKVNWRDVTERNSGTYRYELSTGKIDITDPYTDNFSWEETRYNNRSAYEFRYSQLSSILSVFQSYTVTLHAGKILDSNGSQLDSRTVTWANPSVTPYAVVIPKGAASWLFIILAFAVLAAAGFILYQLIKSGKLSNWATTAFDIGKWKIQETRLNSEIKSLEKDKEILISDLSDKTWEARVRHPAYSEPYEQLESLEQQISELDQEINDLDSNLKNTRNNYTQVKTEFSEKISQLKEAHKNSDKSLDAYRKNQDNLEKQVSKLAKEKDEVEVEIREYEEKLMQVQASDDEDKKEKAFSLNSAISTLNKTLLEITNKIPEIQSEIAKVQVEQQPLVDKITEINDQITKTQADQKSSLEPLDQKISDFEKEIKEKKNTKNDLQQKMKPVISTLGPLVNSARPESEALQPIFGRIDRKNAELVEKSDDYNLLKARLDISDKNALWNFLLTIAGILIAIVLIVVFIMAAF